MASLEVQNSIIGEGSCNLGAGSERCQNLVGGWASLL